MAELSDVTKRRSDMSRFAPVGAYVAILIVTLAATVMAAATALGENRTAGDRAQSTIGIAVLAAVIVAAIAALSLPHTTAATSKRLLVPALLACGALVVTLIVLAYGGTSEALDYWNHPTPTGDAGKDQWRVAALIGFICPFVAAAFAGFRAGAARVFVIGAAAASLAWFAMLAFDQVARTNI